MAALTSLRQLQYLVALADRLSFTRAARDCHATQSTLSAGLKELEQQLGVRLVERDRQSVLMTPIGLAVTQRARAILAATRDLGELAAASAKPMTGLLRLGVIPTIAPFLLPRALTVLRKRYPGLRLALREDLTASLLERLEDGQLDFVLFALPFERANLLIEPLFDDELWIVGRHDDAQLRAARVAVTPALADRLLLLEEGHCLREHALHACGTAEPHRDSAVEATSLLTLVQMVESGLGVGLIPELAVRSGLARSPQLVARPLARPAPRRTIALAARRSTSRLADLQALAEVLRGVH
jgi:LysR family hydrogen peroxide-inducible transcriptional activator